LLAWHSIYYGGLGISWLLQFVLGLFVWTLYEYCLHRFILHGLPIGRDIHALHHKNQLDYIAQPPWLTLTTYGTFFVIFGLKSTALMIGFSTGYVIYAALHTIFHYSRLTPGSLLWKLDQRHVYHHRYGDVCYGISVNLWDLVFKTEYIKD